MSFISTQERKIIDGIKSEYHKLGADAKREVAVAVSFLHAHALVVIPAVFVLGNVVGALSGY